VLVLIKLQTFQRALSSFSLGRLGDKIGVCYDMCIGLTDSTRVSEVHARDMGERYLISVDFYICKLIICEHNETDTVELSRQNSVLILRPDKYEQEVNGQ